MAKADSKMNETLRVLFESTVLRELGRLGAAHEANKRGLLAPLRPPPPADKEGA